MNQLRYTWVRYFHSRITLEEDTWVRFSLKYSQYELPFFHSSLIIYRVTTTYNVVNFRFQQLLIKTQLAGENTHLLALTYQNQFTNFLVSREKIYVN